MFAAAALVTLTLSLPPSPEGGPSIPVAIEARLAAAVAQPTDPVVSRAEDLPRGGSKTVKFKLSAGTWTLRATAKGYWSPSTTIDVVHGPTSATLRLYATAPVVQRIGGLAPGQGTLHVAFRGSPEVPSEAKVPEGALTCPVDHGALQCSLPVGRLDLRLEAQGFVPEYIWSREIGSRGPTTLPPLRLSTGASATGFVRTEDDKPAMNAVVEILTLSGDRIPGAARARPEAKRPDGADDRHYALLTKTNERGFFQIRGVPAGEFQVVARSDTRSGLTSARLEADREIRLRDFLVLEKPVELEVSIEPPMAPAGTPWTMRVVRLEPETTALYARTVARDGRVVVGPLTRGRYALEAWNTGARWFGEAVVIDGPPAPVVIRLQVVRVRGKVTLAGKPLQGRLTFGGVGGPVGIPFESNEDGDFEGSLPRDGDWAVSVEASEPPVTRKLAKVAIAVDAAGEAYVEIDLPDGVVRGRVVDESGDGVRALLNVMPAGADDGNVQVRVEPNEPFVVHGLPEGDTALEAQAEGDRRSDVQHVKITEAKAAEATLVVRGAKPVRGRLRSTDGPPIAGGTILALEADGRSGSPYYRTDAEGWFTLKLRPGTREVTLVYWADGHSLAFLRTELADGPIALTLASFGGPLILDLGRELEVLNGAEPFQVVVRSNGAYVPLGGLLRLILRQGPVQATRLAKTVELPGLSPGTYAACVQDRASAIAGHPPQGPCVEGQLAPGGTLRLSLPAESWPPPAKSDSPASVGDMLRND